MSVTLGDALELAVRLFLLFNVLAVIALSLVWLERKELGRLQGRVGPTRVGPFGLLQPLADGLKLLMKEDIAPGSSVRLIFFVAPLLVFVPAFVVWVTIPFAGDLVVRNLELGLFFFVSVSVLSIVGLVLAGWSSNSKYAILGSFRSAAQLVSYEIPIIMTILVVAILAGSLDFVAVVDAQASVPYAAIVPLAFVVFLIAGLAEVGRTPFDIYFAESEVVGGPFVEYSGAHWAIFFLAEYVNTFVVGILGALLFLGGWRWPFDDPPQLAALALLLGKSYLIVVVIFWVRATYPRMRIDQLMSLGWKLLIPLSFAAVITTAVQMFYGWPQWTLTLMSLGILAVPIYLQLRLQGKPARALASHYAEIAVLVEAKPRPEPEPESAPEGASA
jgi:NADH-quinone oxidoreductase subunit H